MNKKVLMAGAAAVVIILSVSVGFFAGKLSGRNAEPAVQEGPSGGNDTKEQQPREPVEQPHRPDRQSMQALF